MQQKIIENINNADNLENLYRTNKKNFKAAFLAIADNYDTDLVKFWKIRLSTQTSHRKFEIEDFRAIFILSIFSWLIIKIPDFFTQINKEEFFSRNLSLILFNALILFTFWINKIFEKQKIILYLAAISVLAVYLNLIPNWQNDSVVLAFVHSPLFLWCIFGLAFISFQFRNISKRISYIRFNGEYIIMAGLILIAGGLFTAITIELFRAINIDIREFYSENILTFGAVAAPMVAFYLIKIYPDLTSKITPVIARIFTPIVLITLIIYLTSFIFSSGSLIEDRNILIIFNVMLIAVLALTIFSITELDKSKQRDVNVLMLLALAVAALIIDSFALTAIINRLMLGITPNRVIVFGSNVLIFVNLIFIAKNLLLSYFKNASSENVEAITAEFLTYYMLWTLFVIFILPFVFKFQ